jgi:hypothetical protein
MCWFFSFVVGAKIQISQPKKWRHDTQYNDAEPNDTQHTGTCPNQTEHRDNQHDYSIAILTVAFLKIKHQLFMLRWVSLGCVTLGWKSRRPCNDSQEVVFDEKKCIG